MPRPVPLCVLISWLFSFTLLSAPGLAQGQQSKRPQSQQRTDSFPSAVSHKSADSAFSFIEGSASIQRPDSKQSWERMLTDQGLVPWHDDFWHLVAPDGELRASGTFINDHEGGIFLFFFPSAVSATSDATLAWLFKAASNFSFEDGETVELDFAEEPTNSGAKRRQSFSVSLTTNRIVRSTLSIRWP